MKLLVSIMLQATAWRYDDIVNDDNDTVTTTVNRLVSLKQFNSEDRANQQILSPVVHPLHLRFNLFVENEDNTKYIFNPMYEHVLQTLFAKIVSFIDSNDGLAIPNEQFQALAKVSVVFRRAFEASSATINKQVKQKEAIKIATKLVRYSVPPMLLLTRMVMRILLLVTF